MLERLAKLIDVKSIVTFGVVGVILALGIKGTIPADKMYDLGLMVIAYYFGTKKAEYDAQKMSVLQDG